MFDLRRADAAAALPWLRRGIGMAIVAGGGLLLLQQAVVWLGRPEGGGAIAAALRGGMLAAAATALGTLPVLLSQRISQRTSDAMLGFGAGVMLAATAFSLLLPALSSAAALHGGDRWIGGSVVAAAVVLGALALLLAERWLPQDATDAPADGGAATLRRSWLFVGAIALHNIPEGLAIGVAYAGTAASQATALATGIAIQDVPEGLVIALALRSAGYGRGLAVAVGVASGLLEPAAAVLGAAVISVASGLLPWGLALAAGAMLYAITHEAIPGSHRQGNATHASSGLVLGFVLMMLLDTALAPTPP